MFVGIINYTYLSDYRPSDFSIMSFACYDASSYNHSEILICIQVAGSLQESDLKEAFTKIKKHSKLVIPDAGRTVRFRFEVNASPENSQWGFFQPHRRVMGLLVLAPCSSAMEVALLLETFQKQKETFSDFIFNARCFVCGIENTFAQQSKSDMFQFVYVKSWKLPDSDIKDFLTSVYYVLESKRVQIDKSDDNKPPLLTAPFEKNQQNLSDSDSRSFRKKCLGRWKKHLADISLLAGLKLEALQNYQIALDYLTAVNDPVWTGGAQEGLCVTSAIILFGASKSMPKSPLHSATTKQALDPRNLVSAKLCTAELAKLCIQTPEEFVNKYKDAVINYSKNENMGIVELEACIKATKVMSVLHKFIQAAEFLQNAVYIALKVSDEERITKYSVLADLYAEIKFHRKSAFYRRVAAMQCVAPHLQHPDWRKCYGLLQGTFLGYELDFLNDSGLPLSMNSSEKAHGWPQVKIRVLHELMFSARKNGRMKTANRYALYLLMRLHKYLSEAEEKDACAALMSSRREDSAKFPDEMSLPSINLYNLPTVRRISLKPRHVQYQPRLATAEMFLQHSDVEPQPLPEFLRPSRIKPIQGSNSVFLFTPSSYQSEKKKLKHIDFKWCVNSSARVRIQLFNPLQAHYMRVSDMRLICERKEGATFDCRPLNVDVPPGKVVHSSLEILPKSEGTIIITGYEATVFGERSRCYFRNMPWILVDEFEIDVIVELPRMERADSCLSPDANSKSRMTIMLYRGETRFLEVPFSIHCGPVSHVTVKPKAPVLAVEETSFASSSSRQRSLWLQVACDDVQNQLPIESHSSLLLPVIMMTEAKVDDVSSKYPICSCQIKFQYSNALGVAANWCRYSSVLLVASMKPCIVVKNVSARHNIRQGYCVVVVELCNVSEDDVIVCSAKLDPANILKEDVNRLEYEDEKLILAQLFSDDTVTLEVVMETVDLDDCKAKDNTKQPDVNLQEILSDNLALEWIIKDETSSRTGILDLSSYELDKYSVDNLLTPPLQWAVSVAGKEANGETTTCEVGSVLAIDVSMTNISSGIISTIDVELEIFQDQENGFREWNMEENVLCLGCQSQSFHDIKSGEVVQFHCNLLFLLRGQYRFRLRRNFSEPMNEIDQTADGKISTLTSQSHLELVSHKQFSPENRITATQK